MRGVPAKVARGVIGWQLVATREGAALALVVPPAARERDKSKRTGGLTWLRLDATGAPEASAITIAPSITMTGDVDVVRAGNAFVFAWTDASEPDPHVALASVDDAGAAHGPVRALGAAASLVDIASGPSGAALVWEDPLRPGRGMRRVYVAHIDAAPSLDAKTAVPLDLQARTAVELAPTRDGFALLAPSRPCWQANEAACADAPILPTMIRFDARLAVAQVEPLRMGAVREGATLAWGLTCGSGECVALATAPNEDPARVRTVDLKPRATSYRAPLVAGGPPDAPRVDGIATLGVGAFSDIGAARVGDGALVAMLGANVDAPASTPSTPSKRKRRGANAGASAGGATLTVRPLDADGVSSGDAVLITKRALTVGGVAIAPGGHPEDGAALVWVAPESGDPQLHATRVDRTGKRVRDRQLTTAKGEASDAAIAWVGDGWIIAWVDGRDGNGEVYATKVDRDLRRVVKDVRITRAPGDASDVAILARPGAVYLAWADPRESPSDGFADIYTVALRPSDAQKLDMESRVLATAAHSRSPSLAAAGDQLAIAWIEEAPLGADPANAQAYGALMAWLDPHGRPAREPGRVATAGEGFATAVTLDGTANGVHVVLARSARETIELDAMEISHDPTPRPYPLLPLEGPPSLDVAFTLMGDALFFNDEGQGPGERRARRAHIAWRR
jgi:hypothetical protein